MTISKETLPTLAEGVLDMQARGYKVEAALAEGIDRTIADAMIFRKQLCILKDAYLKNTIATCLRRWFAAIKFCWLTRLNGIRPNQLPMIIAKVAC